MKLLHSLLVAFCVALPFATRADVTVPGTGNPWLAGFPDGTTAASSDTAPSASPVLVVSPAIAGGDVLTFNVTGSVSYTGGTPSDSPDGNAGSFLSHLVENGRSALTAPSNALVGVFLDDSVADSTVTPPDGLDFSGTGGGVTGGIGYRQLAPAIGQPFFIGDGKDANGKSQNVVAPQNATKLYLGSMDGSQWNNNTGSFSVAITKVAPTIPTFAAPVQYTDGGQGVAKIVGTTSTIIRDTSGFDTGADLIAPLSLDGSGHPAIVSVDPSSTQIHIRIDKVDNTNDFTTLDVSTAGHPADVAVSDVNGDGQPDIVTCEDGHLVVYINTRDSATVGSLRFAAGVNYTALDANSNPIVFKKLAISDVNGDNKPDLIAVGSLITGTDTDVVRTIELAVFNNDGSGAFPTSAVYHANGTGDFLAVGNLTRNSTDSNGHPAIDPYPEIVVGSNDGNQTSNGSGSGFFVTFLNKTDGTFGSDDDADTNARPIRTPLYLYIHAMALGDISNDGNRDIVVEASSFGAHQTFLNLLAGVGDGSFAYVQGSTGYVADNSSDTAFEGSIALVDLDGNGFLDVVATDPLDTQGVIVWPGDATQAANSAFFPYNGKTAISTGTGARAIGLTSKNQDGQLDIVVANNDANSFTLLDNTTVVATTGSGTDPASPLVISATTSSTSDPLGHATRIGDQLTYTLTFANMGTATAKSLRVATLVPVFISASNNFQVQFDAANISTSPGGQIVNVADLVQPGQTAWILPGGNGVGQDEVTPLDSHGNPRKAIVWSNVGDLNPGFQQFVSYSLKITNAVRVPSGIAGDRVYEVSSAVNQPPGVADEHTSNAPAFGVDVRGPIKLLLTTGTAPVAPGGYIDYTLTLVNLSGKAQYTAAVVDVPDFTRFAGYGLKNGIPVATPPKGITATQVARDGSPNQILIYFGSVKGTQTLHITMQAQWVAPADVANQQISSIDYAGAFFSKDAGTRFLVALQNKSNIDFVQFITDPANTIAASKNDSGIVSVSIAGNTDGEPKLALLASIYDDQSTHADDFGSDSDLPTVLPGQEISMAFGTYNNGTSPAEDVFVESRIPEGTEFVPGSVGFGINGKKVTKSQKLSANPLPYKLDPDGRTLFIGGLHLEPHDGLFVFYTVRMLASSSGGPAPGDTLEIGASSIGSSSTPHTPAGLTPAPFISVIGQTSLNVKILGQIPSLPALSSDFGKTANVLTGILKTDWHALPLLPKVATLPPEFPAGYERFLVHFENTGNTAAKQVTVTVPTPPNTVFYRASFVHNGKLMLAPTGEVLTPPPFLTNGNVTFSIPKLAANSSGDAIVEVIATKGALGAKGSFVQQPVPQIHDLLHPLTQPANTLMTGFHTAAIAAGPNTPVDDPSMPKVGIETIAPRAVAKGSNFDLKIVVFNYGDTPCKVAGIGFRLPANATYVSAYDGGGQIYPPNEFDPGYFFVFASNDGPVVPLTGSTLDPHSAAEIIITMNATGDAGSSITYDTVRFDGEAGDLTSMPSHTEIEVPNQGDSNTKAIVSTITNANFLNLTSGGIIVIPLNGGKAIASGAKDLITAPAATLYQFSNGVSVAVGNEADISVSASGTVGTVTAKSLLADPSKLLLAKAGNFWKGSAPTLIAKDGNGLISNSTGLLAGSLDKLINLSNATSLVASGGGNLVASGGGNLVASGGGNLVASGGGNVVVFGGGGIVASGGGNLVASGGGNLVASGGGNISVSALASTASLVASGGGNLVASGGGNLVATGGGNIVSAGAGLVASGGGNLVTAARRAAQQRAAATQK